MNRNPVAAAEILKPLAEKDSDDQLVYLLEYGIALHEAGQYEESNKFFKSLRHRRDQRLPQHFRIAGSILLNEGWSIQGRDFEKSVGQRLSRHQLSCFG